VDYPPAQPPAAGAPSFATGPAHQALVAMAADPAELQGMLMRAMDTADTDPEGAHQMLVAALGQLRGVRDPDAHADLSELAARATREIVPEHMASDARYRIPPPRTDQHLFPEGHALPGRAFFREDEPEQESARAALPAPSDSEPQPDPADLQLAVVALGDQITHLNQALAQTQANGGAVSEQQLQAFAAHAIDLSQHQLALSGHQRAALVHDAAGGAAQAVAESNVAVLANIAEAMRALAPAPDPRIV
jgi:hypothetical protein